MIIKDMCPNCGGPISEERLKAGLPCNKCLPSKYLPLLKKQGLRKVLAQLGKTKRLVNVFLLEDELKDFEAFFFKLTKKQFWTIQKAWAKRMLEGDSYALIAPTGVGKTTLLQVYALYRSNNGSNVLYIVPTVELMKQVLASFRNYSLPVTVQDSTALKPLLKEGGLVKGRIDVLTHAFIYRNKDLFRNVKYDLVIVDDFDALLKSSSLIDLILNLLGVNEEAIKLARKVVSLKSELMFYKYAGNDEKVNEISETLYKTEMELATYLDVDSMGQLLIASATGRAKGSRIKVLREILGFEVGSIMDYLRNIVEVSEKLSEVDLSKLLKELEGGTLIFVSKDRGLAYARKLVNELRNEGIRVAAATSRKALDMLRSGDADVLVGVATYYGILTRGIDEPLRIYNAIFVGIPKFEFPFDSIVTSPTGFLRSVIEAAKRGYRLSEDCKDLLKILSRLSPGKLKVLQASLKGYLEVEGFLSEVRDRILKEIPSIKKFVYDYVKEKGKLTTDSYIITLKGGKLIVSLPDVMTYIQASGRSSRLLKGNMTLGLSIILYEDEDLLKIFLKKLARYVSTQEFIPLSKLDLKKVKMEQKASRSRETSGLDVERIKSVLIVVESPTKAKTIARMFGKPGRRYLSDYIAYETVIPLKDKVYIATIAPTLGHLLDLTVNEGFHGTLKNGRGLKPIYTTIKRCMNCGYQFTDDVDKCPRCGSSRIRDSRKVVEALRKLAQENDEVIIATDPDDEGEKIAYDVYLLLRPYIDSFRRVEFHEVTRHAFLQALKSPRKLDLRRINAQIVRRVDDRLVGFELSNVLKTRLGKYWLGGGRVQSPVLEWIVERYREYLKSKGKLIVIKLPNDMKITYFTHEEDKVKEVVKYLSENGIFLKLLKEEVKEQLPKPPYTTDSLLYDGMRYLKLTPGKLMRVAQDLFELGFITYHRTDSTHVSQIGIQIAKEYLVKNEEIEFFTPRSWGPEGTHECIRPTKPIASLDEVDELGFGMFQNLTWYHKRLYDLIFRRFIASQMPPAKLRFYTYSVDLGELKLQVSIPTEVLVPGHLRYSYLKVYADMKGKKSLVVKNADVKVMNAAEVRLYTSSDAIKLMKKKGIGRPSTYAKAIENNLRHGYLIASKKRLYLIPTKLGIEVADLIKENYPELADVKATRDLEVLLEHVRKGSMSRNTALVLLLSDVIRIRVKDHLGTRLQEGIPSRANYMEEAT